MNYSIVVFGTSVFKRTDFQKKKKNRPNTRLYIRLPPFRLCLPVFAASIYSIPYLDRVQLRTAGELGEKTEFFRRFYIINIHACVCVGGEETNFVRNNKNKKIVN